MEKRIALVTCSNYPKLTESDRLLAAALTDAGTQPMAVDWRDESARWREFDLAVLRSTWDYHLYPDEFSSWIDQVAMATHLVNSAPLVRWNCNKRYLEELRQRGVPLLPFVLVEPESPVPLQTPGPWPQTDIVVKPLVGASAWQIVRTHRSRLQDVVTPELRRHGYLVQAYGQEIEQGEYSIIFFDGQFSHAVLKKPKSGDFRTQPELGASQTIVRPPGSILGEAAVVLDALPEQPTYARIDGIVQNGHFVLMEAELIEPELFFRLAPAAAHSLATVLLRHS